MNTTHPAISEEELHAFIDRELEPERAAEIGRLAQANPLLGQRIATFRSDKQRLLEAYGAVAEMPVPAHWRRMIEDRAPAASHPARRRFMPPQFIAAIAAAFLVLIGWGISVLHPSASSDEAIVSEALAARDDALHPEQSVAAAAVPRPDERNRVVSAALGMRIKAPDLAGAGYRLDAIEVFSGVPGGKAVEIDYRNMQNERFTLYLRRPTSPPRVDIVQHDGMRICIWQDDVVGAVMAGKMTAGEMARLATVAYSGLFL